MEDLLSTLTKLGRKVYRKYPTINLGGCCVYASIVAQQLEARGIKCSGFVSVSSDTRPRRTIGYARRLLAKYDSDDWEYAGVYFDHIGLEIKHRGRRYLYDTDGCVPAGDQHGDSHVYRGRLTCDELHHLASQAYRWNMKFPRRVIPDLIKMVDNHFQKM